MKEYNSHHDKSIKIAAIYITEYTLHYKTDDGDWIQQRLSNRQDHHTLAALRCGTRYHLYMTASNSLGTGEPSTPVSARTQGAGNRYIIYMQSILLTLFL